VLAKIPARLSHLQRVTPRISSAGQLLGGTTRISSAGTYDLVMREVYAVQEGNLIACRLAKVSTGAGKASEESLIEGGIRQRNLSARSANRSAELRHELWASARCSLSVLLAIVNLSTSNHTQFKAHVSGASEQQTWAGEFWGKLAQRGAGFTGLTCLQSLLITHGHGNELDPLPISGSRTVTSCSRKDLWRHVVKNSPWTRLGPCKVP